MFYEPLQNTALFALSYVLTSLNTVVFGLELKIKEGNLKIDDHDHHHLKST